jgi:hypothetical protein
VYARLPDYKDGFALVQGGHFLPKSFEKNWHFSGKNGEMIANNFLYLVSMQKAQCKKTHLRRDDVRRRANDIHGAHEGGEKTKNDVQRSVYGWAVLCCVQNLVSRKPLKQCVLFQYAHCR